MPQAAANSAMLAFPNLSPENICIYHLRSTSKCQAHDFAFGLFHVIWCKNTKSFVIILDRSSLYFYTEKKAAKYLDSSSFQEQKNT